MLRSRKFVFCQILALHGLLLPMMLAAETHTERLVLLPDYQIYPVNLAHPHRPQFAAQLMNVERSDIPETSNLRFDFKYGARLGLLHLQGHDNPRQGWLLSLDAGFHGQFDPGYSQDNIGWNGIYALLLSYRPHDDLAFKFGVHHISSHVGDEYMQRVGRQRINYTREEFQAGMNLSLDERWQWYVEAGRGYHQEDKPLQERWRAQSGLQYVRVQRGQDDWYVALDVEAMQERDWRLDATLQFGWMIPVGERRWRTGFELYSGRAQIGEFFFHDERYISLGLWLDI